MQSGDDRADAHVVHPVTPAGMPLTGESAAVTSLGSSATTSGVGHLGRDLVREEAAPRHSAELAAELLLLPRPRAKLAAELLLLHWPRSDRPDQLPKPDRLP